MDLTVVRQAVEQLNYDWRQFTLDDFIRHVQQHRGRPITIIGVSLLEFSGLCLSTPVQDYIFYATNRHPTLQQHAKLHEIAHLVLDHTLLAQYRLQSNPHLEILLHVKTRQHRTRLDPQLQREEDEAEYFAFLVQKAVAERQRLHELLLTDADDDVYLPPFTGEFFTGS